MKKSLLYLLLGLTTFPALAQGPAASQTTSQQQAALSKGNAKISGVVLDAATKQPVEFATVALLDLRTDQPVNGTMADDKGRFVMDKVAAGKYKLNVSFIGYQQLVMEEVTVASDNADLNLGTISLTSNSQNLGEVVVTGEKNLVEEKIDRTVYNAEKDATNAGGNAADVMQKVPGLSVDTDGNVMLRGSSNIRVLINNKPSSIMAGSIADALKQIPANMIKSVEVITSPSAKYDAEGSAGIINIITKKDSNMQGVNGSVALTGGTRSSNGNASLNIRQGKLGINSTIGSNLFYNKGDIALTRFSNGGNNIFQFSGNTRPQGGFMNGQVGFDYDINEKNSLSGGVRFNGGMFRMQNDQEISSTIFGEPSPLTYADVTNRFRRQGADINLDYLHTFKPGQELAILSLYNYTDINNKANQDYTFERGMDPYEFVRNINDGGNDELTFQVDYTHPFANKTTLEVGAKTIFRDVDSDARYSTLRTNGPDENSMNIFFYEQDVYASYLTYGFAVKKKLNVKLGGRYEYTDIKADLRTENQAFGSNYDNFIPSVALSYTLKDMHTFKASFTQRIQRPSLNFLNPYRQVQARNTVVVGDPTLDAELTDLFEIGYSTYFKTTSLSASLYMRQTDNAIETLPYLEDDSVTVITFRNIAQNKTYGINLFGSVKPVNDWTISGSSNIYFVDLNSQQYGSNNGWMYNINLNSAYQLGKGYSAQFNGGFNSRRIQLQGSFASFSYHSLAFKKELFDKKGGISFGIDNPFRRNMRMRTNFRTDAFDQNIVMNNYNRGFKVTFNYNFGQMQQTPARRKKSIRNDDAKQGEGGGLQ
ncbi:TonB-dependent receptor [Pontibacter qinzhouensis]|uniref:TonB-dependent receptor n=1 Tax=Pontibacter qinzhouensis TaxID=2603253 RepID=A0A5C8J1S3_9BACT|nr:outer membrane beta-barrel family protein [Pontibacter qinzhouensis]TXK27724.1 TonB-dependent receptor [Pontibacter qinzhouensis]